MIYGRLTADCPFTGPDMKPRVFPVGTVVVADHMSERPRPRWRNIKVLEDPLFDNPSMKRERIARLSPLEILALAPDLDLSNEDDL